MKWISVNDRLPNKQECEKDHGWFVVARKGFSRVDMSRYDGHTDSAAYMHGWKYEWDQQITHWMQLPGQPKEL